MFLSILMAIFIFSIFKKNFFITNKNKMESNPLEDIIDVVKGVGLIYEGIEIGVRTILDFVDHI